MNRGILFDQHIGTLLHSAGIPFKAEVALGGIRSDFVLATPDGRTIVLEAKSWDPNPDNQARAIHQARLCQSATGADRAFVVLQGLENGRPSEGLVAEKELVNILVSEFRQQDLPLERLFDLSEEKLKKFSISESMTKRLVFAAMPFAPEYDDVYYVAMAPAVETVNAECKRIDQEEFQGDIVEEIKRLLDDSVAVIADLSEANPNVLYEVGLAHGKELRTIHICSTPLESLPFDVRNWNTISYLKGQTHKLKEKLTQRLKSIL